MIPIEILKSVVAGASIEIRKMELLYEKDPTINETGHHDERMITMISMRDKIIDEVIRREKIERESSESMEDSRD